MFYFSTQQNNTVSFSEDTLTPVIVASSDARSLIEAKSFYFNQKKIHKRSISDNMATDGSSNSIPCHK